MVARRGMASFKAKFPVLQELFAKNHRGGGPLGPLPSGARVKQTRGGELGALSVRENPLTAKITPSK